MIGEVLADVLLGLAVAIVLASSIGVLVMRDAYQKLHYITPLSLVAPVVVGLSVLARSGLHENTAQTWLALIFMMIASPVLSHATIRAARIRQTGDWRGGADRGDGSGGGRP
jgi:monovalent cation/proton antiporter MnhG/PhaG subunit